MTEFHVTYRGTVYPWHCDHIGHMNVMWYSGKFDEATWQLLAKLGLTRAHFREHGAGMVAVEQNITYKRELLAGDIVTVRSRLLEINEKSVRLLHEMINDETGELAAVSEIVGVYMDTTLRKARAFPADLRERADLAASGLGDGDRNRFCMYVEPDESCSLRHRPTSIARSSVPAPRPPTQPASRRSRPVVSS